MDAATSPVRVERHGPVGVVVIDHAPVNALSKGVRQGLRDAVGALGADPGVSAIVLSGGPGRFIAGADIREMSLPPDDPLLPDVIAAIDALDKPVVAAIDGAALGGGCEVALACDLRIASPKALVGLTETRLGIIPGAGGTQNLPRAVGARRARQIIYSAQPFSAAQAADWGMVNEVHAPEALLPRALELARIIAANGPISIRQAKRAVGVGIETDLKTGLAIEVEAYNRCVPTEDRREGVRAFNEKRSPVFTGR